MTLEEWRAIPEYEGLYEVSSLDRIRSLDRYADQTTRWGNVVRHLYKGCILKPRQAANGYLYVHLSKEGKRKTVKNHRITAQVFVPNAEDLPQVNHVNGCKTDNRAVNLEWVTASENILHARETGLTPPTPDGESSYAFKGSVKVFSSEGVHVATLAGERDIRQKGFTPAGVSAVLTGRAKTHRGCTFFRE